MAKQDTYRHQSLISDARQFDYYASVTTGESSARWTALAAEKRAQAEALPDDYIDPNFQMPAWGTYGT